jgi:AraC-like DNA-binding protein
MENFSEIQQFNLNWLSIICWGLLVLIVLDTTLPILGVLSADLYYTFLLINSLFVVAATYLALGTSPLQVPAHLATSNNANEANANGAGKYSRSSLNEDSARHLANKLQNQMAAQRWYLEEDLSLRRLADLLNSTPHHLSQVLNEQLQKTFYDYINEVRVEAVQRLLVDDPQRPITDIAYACGYNNKVTFYNAFKRCVGLTPSQFRKREQIVASR